MKTNTAARPGGRAPQACGARPARAGKSPEGFRGAAPQTVIVLSSRVVLDGAGGTAPFRRWGFTLIEVMMGAAILSVILVSMFAIVTVGLFMTGTSRENLRATQIMLDKMEGLRLYTPAELTNTHVLVPAFTNWFYETNNIGMTNAQGYGVQYTGSITISPVTFSTSYSTNMQMVTVNVGWQSGGQGKIWHTRSMGTFYATQGLANYVWASP